MSTRLPEEPSTELALSPQGPVLMQNFGLIEKMADFARESIYAQAGSLFRRMTSEARQRLFGNVARVMGSVPRETQMRAICHFYRADVNYGVGAARALGINIEQEMSRMASASA
ncbi:catalase-related domain-containing protein [Roseimicrobium sp. ORNL1]|uniref:catalase-related domain-containing protein n=1 Tax=Roseimicrobium sp. ORNL1 TaxID=2711231 RepID=UPI0013E1B020|nr:catalase-related domain-containing protein [Roseimicrobium sp. ORNL1]QIF00210.1 hypothetical protein G5S37_01290 [Roseimicrobium sp. ORNL1]